MSVSLAAELIDQGVLFDPDDNDGTLEINMNDVWGWAVAAGHRITMEDVPTVHEIFFGAPSPGEGGHALTRWVCEREGAEPFDLWKEKYGWPDYEA